MNLDANGRLIPASGGTSLDTSASTGIPHVAAGVWSVSTLTTADIGTGALTSSTVLRGDGTYAAGVTGGWSIGGLATVGSLSAGVGGFSGLLSATSHIFNGVGTHTTGNTEMLSDAAGGNLKIYAPTGKTMGLYFADILGTSFSATGQTITGTVATDGPTASANLVGAGNWTSTGWTGAGPYTHTVGNTTALSNTLAGAVGTQYVQVVTITARTAGSIVVAFGGNTTVALTATGTAYFQATTTGALTVTPTTDFDGTVAVTVQAYTAPASPVFSIKDSSNTVRLEIRSSAALANTYIGFSCGSYSVTGTYNTGIGYQSLYSNLTGTGNVATGYQSLYSNTTGINNVAAGFQSLFSNTTGGGNVATGASSLFSNTTGINNVAAGYQSLYSNLSGIYNVATGYQSLYSNTTGTGNVATGYYSLYSNTTGNNNVATGPQSLYSNLTGTGNVATGAQSLYSNTTGYRNIATGYNSLYYNTTGYYNVANGYQSGYNSGVALQTLSLCSFFGYSANSSVDGITNSTALGNAAQVTASNQMVLGNASVTAVNTSGKIGNTNAANPVQFAIPTPVPVIAATATAIPGLSSTFRGCIEVQGSDGSYGRFQLPQGSTTSTLVYGSATVSGGVPVSHWGIDYSSGWRYNNQTGSSITFTLIEALTGIA